ncbi:hypothetical protein GTW43_21965 [Streptomyces sp. SID5785]|uniref:hypothetical protein n=1 Tax=Streptomyces sp. SID5785 TaxID=2690309 RepID=UPI0013616DC7|nr:hypothetical protein [Streptomyces sp. SID5785]MZD07725.1 hypothetical protein [Streptomyces sp. SID5785]
MNTARTDTGPAADATDRTGGTRRATLRHSPASQQATDRRGGTTPVAHRHARAVRTGRPAGAVEGEDA